VCKSRNPLCDKCPIQSVCDKRDVGIAKKNLRKQSDFINS
jgi:adenine-specific DNA glycosylase